MKEETKKYDSVTLCDVLDEKKLVMQDTRPHGAQGYNLNMLKRRENRKIVVCLSLNAIIKVTYARHRTEQATQLRK